MSLTLPKFWVNHVLWIYGLITSSIIFQIVIPPIITPITPIPIAKNKKFFFSGNVHPTLYALIIDNVPSKASSSLTVSVA